MKKIRVVMADGYKLARDALNALLATVAQIEVIGEAGEGSEAILVALDLQPDVVVMHASMPGMRNFAAVRAMRAAGVCSAIVVLARHSTPEDESLALEAGADGYLPYEAGGDEFIATLRSVHGTRRSHLQADVGDGAPVALDDAHLMSRLSARERETLRLVVEGHSSSEIARLLQLSSKSVDTYRSRIMAKLGVSGMPALVKLALQHGVTTFN